MYRTAAHSTVSTEDFQKFAPNGVFILGQNQDSPGENFDFNQAFSGELSQVGIWDRILTLSEIRQMTTCEVNLLVTSVIDKELMSSVCLLV